MKRVSQRIQAELTNTKCYCGHFCSNWYCKDKETTFTVIDFQLGTEFEIIAAQPHFSRRLSRIFFSTGSWLSHIFLSWRAGLTNRWPSWLAMSAAYGTKFTARIGITRVEHVWNCLCHAGFQVPMVAVLCHLSHIRCKVPLQFYECVSLCAQADV